MAGIESSNDEKEKYLKNDKNDASAIDVEESNSRKNFWENCIEMYLSISDFLFRKVKVLYSSFHKIAQHIPEANSKLFLQITIILIIVTMAIILSSCQIPRHYSPHPYQRPVQGQQVANKPTKPIKPTKQQEQLFIKRDSMHLRQREVGSTTGSLWSDTLQPRALFGEARPSRVGEVLTILIPEDLQYHPPAADKQKQANQTNNTPGNPQQVVFDLNQLNNTKYEPARLMKFEIVGMDPSGDVYLRGVKQLVTPSRENHNVMITAKLPQRSITGFNADARDLTQIALNEQVGDSTSDYFSTGWDLTVSRKISGFVPDLNSGTADVEIARKELQTAQDSLRNQQKSINEERERLRKERDRLAAQAARQQDGLNPAPDAANNTTNNPANNPAPPGGQNP